MKDIKCMVIGQFEDGEYSEVWNPDKIDTITFISEPILPRGVNLTDPLLTSYLAASLMNRLLAQPEPKVDSKGRIMLGAPHGDLERQVMTCYCNNFFNVETIVPPGLINMVTTRKNAYQFTIRRLPPSALLPDASSPEGYYDAYDLLYPHVTVKSIYAEQAGYALPVVNSDSITFTSHYYTIVEPRFSGEPPLPDHGIDDGGITPVEPKPPVISCTPTSFNITKIQGDTSKDGHVIAVASIWYEGKEYPYITGVDQMSYLVANVDGNKVTLASGFNTGINIYDKVYNRYPEFCKAIVLARNRTDNFFIAGASMGNLDKYALTPRIWDMRPYEQSFKRDTMRPVEAPSQLRLTKLSPEMQQFIKDNHEYGVFFNGKYNVNNLVDLVNQGNDIIIDACVKVESNMFDKPPEEPPVEPVPPVISCTPTSFNVTQIQGAITKGGHVVVGASIWYEGKEYPYIIVADPMELSANDVNRTKLNLGAGFRKGITMYYDAYKVYPEYCKMLVITRNTNDNYFIAGAGTNNLEMYVRTPDIWDGGGPDRIFNPDTVQVVNESSQLRLTKLSPEMTQFIKAHGGNTSGFLNGDYPVNNLVDMINQGNDIIINACVKMDSNLFKTTLTPPVAPPVVTTPPKPAMAITNMTSDTPFISTFKNGFELESYYDAEAGGYRIENENNKIYLRDPAYAPVVSFRPKQGNLMGATQIQGEVYDWKGIGFDIRLATPKHLNKIQNIYDLPSNDVVLVVLSQLNEEQTAPSILNGRFVCNPETE